MLDIIFLIQSNNLFLITLLLLLLLLLALFRKYTQDGRTQKFTKRAILKDLHSLIKQYFSKKCINK